MNLSKRICLICYLIFLVPHLALAASKNDEDSSPMAASQCLEKIDERLKSSELSVTDRNALLRIQDDLATYSGKPEEREKKILAHLKKHYASELAIMERNGAKVVIDADSSTCNSAGLYYQRPEKKLVICNTKDEISAQAVSITFEHEFLHFVQGNNIPERESLTQKFLSIHRNGADHVPTLLCNHSRDTSFLKMQNHLNEKLEAEMSQLSPEKKELLGQLDQMESLYSLELDPIGQLTMKDKYSPNQEAKLQEIFANIVKKAKGDRGKATAVIESNLPYYFGEYFNKNDSCKFARAADIATCFEEYKKSLTDSVKSASSDSAFKNIMDLGYKQNRCLTHLAHYCDELQANAHSEIKIYNIIQTLSKNGLKSHCRDFELTQGKKALDGTSSEQVEESIYAGVRSSISKSKVYGAQFSQLSGYNYPLFDVKYCARAPDWSFFESGCPGFDPATQSKSSENQSGTSQPSMENKR